MIRTEIIPAEKVQLTGGFWKDKRDLMRRVTLDAVYDRFQETGRFRALFCRPEPGMPKPHIFWDSDVAKWIEGAAYLLYDGRDEDIEARVDAAVEAISGAQLPDGYFNSYFIPCEPEARFTRYTDHELYCLGHLIEAAVAYAQVTGKRKLLDVCVKYVELADQVFRVEHSAAFDTPGHEEIELALYRLYQFTREERYLRLMRYFVDARGRSTRDRTYEDFGTNRYSQAHLPVREQLTAEGHAVRALYLYCAMADQAMEDGDQALEAACRALTDNIAEKRMYITGAVGSSHLGEAFTFDYDLMNRAAYAETCASIALALFMRRMSRMEADGRYADIAELALYNGALSGVSLSGDAFFYENPLESHPDLFHQNELYPGARDHAAPLTRKRVFDCSCCPPNILRTVASVQEFAYSQTQDMLYVHHYMSARAETNFGVVTQRTDYPITGRIEFVLPEGRYTLALRIPGWAKHFQIWVNGETVSAESVSGYARIAREWAEGDALRLELPMEVRLMRAHPAVHENCGRVAVMRGPVVFCAEAVDNGRCVKDLAISRASSWTLARDEKLGVYCLKTIGSRGAQMRELYTDQPEIREATDITLIPYHAWANRGESEMSVWIREESI